MKKLLTLVTIALLYFSSNSMAQVVVYDIGIGSTIGLEQTTGDICTAPWNVEEARQIAPGNIWGCTWTSTNGNTPLSIDIELQFTINEWSINSYPSTLNAVANNTLNSGQGTLCGGFAAPITWSLNPASYNPGGVNTFQVNYTGGDTVNQLNNLPYPGDPYLRVTVDYGTCMDPVVQSATGDVERICVGESATITVNGSLNDATDWFLYSGSCGGTLEAQNNTGVFTVSPTVSTTYFVRGEGGCVTPGACDTVALGVDQYPSTVVVQSGTTLLAQTSSATYQWLDCDNNYAVIPGETNQTFVATMNGNYAVQLTENGCVDTSACYNVTGIGIEESMPYKAFVLYPNPVNEQLTISFPNGLTDKVLISVLDLSGRTIYEEQVATAIHTVDVTEFTSGIYFVKCSQNNSAFVQKLVVR